eukprot:1156987-Pelagomonas_calceolata.AAC.7
MQPALRLAQASVEPVLGVTFGVHSRRTRNQAQSQSNKEPGPAHWGYDPTNPYNHPFGKGYGPHPGNSSTAGGGHWEGTDPMADYKTQVSRRASLGGPPSCQEIPCERMQVCWLLAYSPDCQHAPVIRPLPGTHLPIPADCMRLHLTACGPTGC